MARGYAYWVNYVFTMSRDQGEGSAEYIVPAPLTRGEQVAAVGRGISAAAFGSRAEVTVRTFQLLREV